MFSRLRNYTLVTFVALGFLWYGWGCHKEGGSEQLRSTVEVVHDCGIIPTGQAMDTTFLIVNTENTPIHLEVAGKSCGCAEAKLSNERLAPGESGSLLVKLKGQLIAGAFSASIAIAVEPPELSPRVFTVKGVVRDLFRSVPRVLNMGDVQKDDLPVVAESEITLIEDTCASNFVDATISTSAPFLEGALASSGPSVFRLQVELKENAPQGVIREELYMNSPRMTEYTFVFPVVARVLGPVHIDPNVLNITDSYSPLLHVDSDDQIAAIHVKAISSALQDLLTITPSTNLAPATILFSLRNHEKGFSGTTGYVEIALTFVEGKEAIVRVPVIVRPNELDGTMEKNV